MTPAAYKKHQQKILNAPEQDDHATKGTCILCVASMHAGIDLDEGIEMLVLDFPDDDLRMYCLFMLEAYR